MVQVPIPTSVRLALSPRELDAAYRLLHDSYVEQGYQEPDPSGVRLLPPYALPTTYTFLVLQERNIVGTASLVGRGALGLPMEAQHQSEILELCSRGRNPGEISGLAFQTQERAAVLRLMRSIVAFATRVVPMTDFCIAVNPAHVRFYTKCLLFEDLGEVRPCNEVNGAPAVPLRLDLETAVERWSREHAGNVIGRYFSAGSVEGEVEDYPTLAAGLKKDLLPATLARLQYARRWMEDSPTRRWKIHQTRVIERECKEETRRLLKKDLAVL